MAVIISSIKFYKSTFLPRIPRSTKSAILAILLTLRYKPSFSIKILKLLKL